MIDTFTIPAYRLAKTERDFLCTHLTWPGSDFHRALRAGTQHGTICLALDQGEIVGWARTEKWENWPTLEAFVRREWRVRGVATLCAAGLRSSSLFEHANGYCAVFHESIRAIAATVGLAPILFQRDGDSWRVHWE